MSTIGYKEAKCEKCRRPTVTKRIPVFKNPAIEGVSGADTCVGCGASTASDNYFKAVKEAVAADDKDKTYGHDYPPWSQLKLSTG